jgi:hypothetical protein
MWRIMQLQLTELLEKTERSRATATPAVAHPRTLERMVTNYGSANDAANSPVSKTIPLLA